MFRYLILVATTVACLACGGAPKPAGGTASSAPQGQTVVLVTVEAWRWDSDPGSAFRDSRVVFADTTTVVPMARPALAAILTGRGPDRLQVRDNFGDTLRPEVKTLAGAFGAAGFTSAGFVASPAASYGSGFERDFALFDGPEDLVVGPGRFYPKVRPAGEVVGNFAAWVQGAPRDRNLFAWIHLADAAGAATAGTLETAKTKYLECVSNIAAGLSGIEAALETSGRARSAAVLIVGTHGVLLGEDGARGSSYWLRRETLRVPLLIAGTAANGRFTPSGRAVSVLDVAPTLAALGGIPQVAEAEGMDLAAPQSTPRTRVAWTWAPDDENAWPTLTAVETADGWQVQAWPNATSFARPAIPRARHLRQETLERLSRVGVNLDISEDAPSPTIADVNAFWNVMASARHSLAQDKYVAALATLRNFEAQHRGQLVVATHRLFLLSVTSSQANDRVRGVADEILRRFPLRSEALHWAAHAAFLDKQYERAEALVLASAEIGPADADHYYDLACSRSLAGDVTASIDYLGKAISAGYRNWDWMGKDTDLANARADARFAQLLRSHGR